MKKSINRLISLALVFIMVFSAAPVGALTGFDLKLPEWLKSPLGIEAKAADYSGMCGDNLTWTFDINTGALNISGTGPMYNYYAYSSYNLGSAYLTATTPWHGGIYGYTEKHIQTVTIGNGVTHIGNYAFEECTNLTSVTIGSGVMSIGANAFYNCEDLSNVFFNGNNFLTDIGYEAFYGCTNLSSFTMPVSVLSIGDSAFYGCTNLSSIIIPNGTTNIGGYAFNGCTSLTSITMPDSVTSIGARAVHGTAWLNNQSNGLVYAGKVAYTYKGSMPEGITITLLSGTKGIANHAFSEQAELAAINIPDSVTNIGGYAFYRCANLTTIIVSDNVSNIEAHAFENTAWLNNQPDGLVYVGKVAYVYKGTMSSDTSITLEPGTKGIAGRAFENCADLTSVAIPDSVINIGYYPFNGCTKLENICLDSENTNYLCQDGVLFNKEKTRIVAYPEGSVRTIYSIPSGVKSGLVYSESLTDITIPDSYTADLRYCLGWGNLATITVSSANPQYSDQNGVLFNKDKTVLIRYPMGKENIGYSIPDTVKYILQSSFSECTKLENTIIPNSVKLIDRYAFSNCSNLKSVILAGNVNVIGDGAFSGCTALTNFELYNTYYVSSNAFLGCKELKSITATGSGHYTSYDGVLYYNNPNNDSQLYIYPEGKTETSYTVREGTAAIINKIECESLTEITVPSSVGYLGSYTVGYIRNQKISGFTIRCYENSVAQKYANSNGFVCYLLDTCTAIFMADGINVATVNYCKSDTTIDEPVVPTKKGYTGRWEAYTLGISSVTVDAVYTPVEYTATFVTDTTMVDTRTFTVEDSEIESLPTIPAKSGYSAKWENYSLGCENITINAIYTPIEYDAVFYADMRVIAVKKYTVESTAIDEPNVPEKEGYTGNWESYNFDLGGLIINAIYTPNELTATFMADGKAVSSVTFKANATSLSEPDVPIKAGYIGFWEAYTLGTKSLTVNAIYTPIQYTATFVTENWNTVGTAKYTVESTTISEPAVPTKSGYIGVWNTYTFEVGGITVIPIYTPIEYTAKFVTESGSTVSTEKYTVESTHITEPNVPPKTGYTGAWNSYAFDVGGITVSPRYTPIEYSAKFVSENGSTVGTVKYTIESTAISEPAVPPKSGYIGVWNAYTFDVGGITVTPRYTSVTYYAVFKSKGTTVASVPYTVESFTINEPTIPSYSGYNGVWERYSFDVGGVTVNAVYTPINVSSLTISQSTATIKYKDTLSLGVTVSPDDALNKSVKWASNNPGVATVDAETGVVTAVGNGIAIITATAADGSDATTSCTVTVQTTWWQWLIKILLFGWIWY